jgi:hypothetical protein
MHSSPVGSSERDAAGVRLSEELIMVEKLEIPLPHELAHRWPGGTHTDPVWMEYLLHAVELDADVRTRLLTTQFETLANVHAAQAEGYKNVVKILGGGSRGG